MSGKLSQAPVRLLRDDTLYANGQVTVRRSGLMRLIGVGAELAGTKIRMPIHNLHITIIDADTGEIIRDLTLDTTRDYQPTGKRLGPPKGSPKGYKYPPRK